jgi:hypothetical protein
MPDIDIKIQYHSPDQAFAAVFIRNGEPWYLDGALVGMASTPAQAVADLLDIAQHLVLQGENFLTQGAVISLEDRKWLFSLLDGWGDWNTLQEMYVAVRRAEEEKTIPYVVKGGETEIELNFERCGFRWREAPQPGESDHATVVRTCTLPKWHDDPVYHVDHNAPNG